MLKTYMWLYLNGYIGDTELSEAWNIGLLTQVQLNEILLRRQTGDEVA